MAAPHARAHFPLLLPSPAGANAQEHLSLQAQFPCRVLNVVTYIKKLNYSNLLLHPLARSGGFRGETKPLSRTSLFHIREAISALFGLGRDLDGEVELGVAFVE
jgi:hypothetical protein